MTAGDVRRRGWALPPPQRIEAPAEPLLTLDQAKLWLEVTDCRHDLTIEALVEAATAHLDGWAGVLGRCLVAQRWRQAYPCWPAEGRLPLPFDGAREAVLAWSDAEGDWQQAPDGAFEIVEEVLGSVVRLRRGFVRPPLDLDTAHPVRVEFETGYGRARDVPAPLRQVVRELVGHWFEHREAVVVGTSVLELPLGVAELMAPYRRMVL